MECDLARRLLVALFLGGTIGWERRDSDRPAGIRTMSLVSLGSCLFTICSMFSFMSGPMNWDASRVSAAIPSGVGFLGAGLIWKGSVGHGASEVHQVHGLTTAASVWLSAAVGVGAGGKLYFISAYCVALIIAVLRFGPRMYGQDEAGGYHGEDEESGWDTDGSQGSQGSQRSDDSNREDLDEVGDLVGGGGGADTGNGTYGSVNNLHDSDREVRRLLSKTSMDNATASPVGAVTAAAARKRKKKRASDVKNMPSFKS